MAITAADVKKLRDATGAGMMDAKKALTEANGDFEAATEILRITGAAKVSSRADREASNGLVAAAGTTLVQLGAETDFVAKNEEFVSLAAAIVDAVQAAGAADLEAAKAVQLGDVTVEEAVSTLSAKIGEKLELAQVATFEAPAAVYLHRRSQDLPPQVGVMVEYEGTEDDEFVRGIAMQIAAMSPQWLDRDAVPAEVIEKERHVAELTAKEEGKPEHIIGRIIDGRLNGFFKDVTLLEQQSVSDDKKTVGQLLKDNGVTVKRFVRFSVGA